MTRFLTISVLLLAFCFTSCHPTVRIGAPNAFAYQLRPTQSAGFPVHAVQALDERRNRKGRTENGRQSV